MLRNKSILFCIIILYILNLSAGVGNTQEVSLLHMQNEAHTSLLDGIKNGDVSKIYQSLDILHKALELNPNFFEVLRDISIAYFSLGDLYNAKNFTAEALLRNSDDKNLRLLELFIDITENKLNVAKEKINKLKLEFPFSIEVNFMEIIYASTINDRMLVDNLIYQLRNKYGSDNLYSYILTVITDINDMKRSDANNSDVANLQTQYGNELWVKWLLATYYLKSDYLDKSLDLLKSLENSGITRLERFAFEERILIEFKKFDFNTMSLKAYEYTQKYPKIEKSWELLGLSYYYLKNYKLSERAFARALELNEDNFLLDFMYDTILKIGGSELNHVRKKHTEKLEAEIRYYFETGDVHEAEDHIEHALYVNPLLVYPREMLARLYALEGNYFRATKELEALIERGYGNSEMEQNYKDYKNKSSIVEVVESEIFSEAHLDEKSWIMELVIHHDHSGNEISVMYEPFINGIFLKREFSLSPYIQWVTEDYQDISNVRYSFEITFAEKQDNSLVNIKLRDRITKATLYSLDKIYTYQDSLYRMSHDIRDIIEDMIPKIAEVVKYDKISSEIILDTSKAGSIEVGSRYKLYPSRTTYSFRLTDQGDHFDEIIPPLGQVEIKKVSSHYSVANLVKSDNVFNDEYLRMVRGLREDDFIVIPPKPWDELSRHNDIVSILKSSKSEGDVSYYLKNMFMSELIFSLR